MIRTLGKLFALSAKNFWQASRRSVGAKNVRTRPHTASMADTGPGTQAYTGKVASSHTPTIEVGSEVARVTRSQE